MGVALAAMGYGFVSRAGSIEPGQAYTAAFGACVVVIGILLGILAYRSAKMEILAEASMFEHQLVLEYLQKYRAANEEICRLRNIDEYAPPVGPINLSPEAETGRVALQEYDAAVPFSWHPLEQCADKGAFESSESVGMRQPSPYSGDEKRRR
jgi:hypothetical protein